MPNEELNLQPLQELLTTEVAPEELARHLSYVCHYFSRNSMKASCWEAVPVDEQEVICLHWLSRLRQVFEAV